MATKANRGNESRNARLNFRELIPVRSVRHPEHLRDVPSDALGVLWLDMEGAGSYPRFAYLNRARAEALFAELHRLLNAGAHPNLRSLSAAERAERILRRVDLTGEASGA